MSILSKSLCECVSLKFMNKLDSFNNDKIKCEECDVYMDKNREIVRLTLCGKCLQKKLMIALFKDE